MKLIKNHKGKKVGYEFDSSNEEDNISSEGRDLDWRYAEHNTRTKTPQQEKKKLKKTVNQIFLQKRCKLHSRKVHCRAKTEKKKLCNP